MSGSFTELVVSQRSGLRGPSTTPTDIVWYSDDGGVTYTLSEARLSLVDESSLVELANGSVLLNMRNAGATEAKCRLQSRSDDGGATWGPIVPVRDLPSPTCEGSIAADAANSDLYFSNPASVSARQNMTVHRSTDGGTTWPQAVVVHPGPSAYSCIVDLTSSNGTLGVLYEASPSSDYGDLHFAVVSKGAF